MKYEYGVPVPDVRYISDNGAERLREFIDTDTIKELKKVSAGRDINESILFAGYSQLVLDDHSLRLRSTSVKNTLFYNRPDLVQLARNGDGSYEDELNILDEIEQLIDKIILAAKDPRKTSGKLKPSLRSE